MIPDFPCRNSLSFEGGNVWIWSFPFGSGSSVVRTTQATSISQGKCNCLRGSMDGEWVNNEKNRGRKFGGPLTIEANVRDARQAGGVIKHNTACTTGEITKVCSSLTPVPYGSGAAALSPGAARRPPCASARRAAPARGGASAGGPAAGEAPPPASPRGPPAASAPR